MRIAVPRALLALLALPVLLVGLARGAAADTFSFSGDRLDAELAKGRERTVLAGHARLVSDQFTIEADSIELYGEDFNLALCRGRVRITDTKNDTTFTCDEVDYDRKERVIRLQGNAVMEDRKHEMVIKGELLENRDKEGVTLIQIGVRILKKDLASRSQMARYFRDDDRLELSGLPVVRWKGDTYRAARINVDLKSDKIQLEGAVSGEVSYEEKKGEKKQGEGAAPEGAAAPEKPAANEPGSTPPQAPAPDTPAPMTPAPMTPAPMTPAPAEPVDPPARAPEAPR